MNSKENSINVFSSKDNKNQMSKDFDFDELKISEITQPDNGVAFISPDKKRIIYTPNTDYSNTFTGVDAYNTQDTPDIVRFTVTDGNALVSSIVSFFVCQEKTLISERIDSIADANNPPIANPDTANTHFRNTNPVTINVLANDIDGDGDTLTITNVTVPPNGTAQIVNSKIVYNTSGASNIGTVRFHYTITDGIATSTTNVDINIINSPPIAGSDSYSRHWKSLPFNLDVMNNDADPDTADVPFLSIVSVSTPTIGSVQISGKILVYTPPGNAASLVTFTYTISDSIYTSTAMVTINLLNNAPIATNKAYNGHKRGTSLTYDVLVGDSDPDLDPISIKSVQTPGQGTCVIENNKIIYTANSFVGLVQFTYTITDGNKDATAQIDINLINNPPVAVADSARVKVGSSVMIFVLLNDYDVNGDMLSISSVPSPSKGIATIVGAAINYTAPSNFIGSLTFTYIVTDGIATSVGTVYVEIVTEEIVMVGSNIFGKFGIGTTTTYTTPQKANLNNAQVKFT
jgi:large repetitive protein